ncbi:acyl-CoA thioester hydrolase [Clostridium acidisoli DSM 12555]|uniref:Acyl-CoA thioester hydrolase n=1 Tax=Clostridium acidisoli DSM 12555 TaxID=1121291 RepID=A0A1W1XQE1_9CLOT|nr:thioesterase family protein [Clostridium acidisoli]SMC26116.1 acyl-CoA thioester hydrolase [Clostridium acidisoli DSM 12555]
MFINETKLNVRYAETDKMGIVHHSKYYVWFEVARDEFISKLNITYKEIEDMGIMMPLIETHCKYLEGAKYGDEIIIKTSIEQLTGVKVVFKYEVFRASDDKILAKGSTVQAFVSSNEFKIINIKRKYPELWSKINII